MSGKKQNNIVFKIKTPPGLTKLNDIKVVEDIIRVDVIEFKTGKKLGNYRLDEFKLKFM